MSTSVVIIGAGPTGLMLALELSLLNISFRIFDSLPGPKPQVESRALSIHPRTLELLVRHGLSERLVAAGLPMKNMRLFVSQRLCSEASLPGDHVFDTSFPHTLVLNQAITEKILIDRLRDYGHTVEWDMSAQKVVLDMDGDRVAVWVKGADEAELLIKCQYVVGCDGAHSIVRKSAGIKFEGDTYPQHFILADVKLEWEQKKCPHMFLGQGVGWLAAFPMTGKDNYRLVCLRNLPTPPTQPLPKPHISELEKNIATLVPGQVRLYDLTWLSSFRIHRRIANTYRNGRFLIAGDAAHIHAPFGGQGMNSGIQDAANLAWKLARVLHSSAATSLLDSYDSERRKVGKAMLRMTDQVANSFMAINPVIIWLRNTAFTWLLPLVGGLEKNGEKFSQLNIRYRDSKIVGTAVGWTGRLKGGDRARDGKILNTKGHPAMLQGLFKEPIDHLILFGGPNASSTREISHAVQNLTTWMKSDVIIHVISCREWGEEKLTESYVDPGGKAHALYDFVEPGYVLVRPDGHISFIGTLSSIHEMKDWLAFQMEGIEK